MLLCTLTAQSSIREEIFKHTQWTSNLRLS